VAATLGCCGPKDGIFTLSDAFFQRTFKLAEHAQTFSAQPHPPPHPTQHLRGGCGGVKSGVRSLPVLIPQLGGVKACCEPKKPRFVGDGVLGSLISPPHPRSNPHLKTTNPKQHTKPSLLLVWLFCLCRACLLVFASWIKRQIPANKLRTPKAKPRQRGPLWVAFLCLWLVVVVCGGGWGFCFVAFAHRFSG